LQVLENNIFKAVGTEELEMVYLPSFYEGPIVLTNVSIVNNSFEVRSVASYPNVSALLVHHSDATNIVERDNVMVGAGDSLEAAITNTNRTMTFWLTSTNHGCTNYSNPKHPPIPCPRNATPGSKDWDDRIANITAHKDNVTGIIPCIHAIGPGGKLVPNDDNYAKILPYLPAYKSLGLKVYAFLGNVGGQGSLQAAMNRGQSLFADAIAMAKRNGYDGYSSDEELRGHGASIVRCFVHWVLDAANRCNWHCYLEGNIRAIRDIIPIINNMLESSSLTNLSGNYHLVYISQH
jgi:hypothetical protein